MLCALTPLGKVAQGRRSWLIGVAGFTAAGLAASAGVGAGLGALGHALGGDLSEPGFVAIAAPLGLVAALREWRLPRIPLVQLPRATRDAWARRWGHRRAALLWGIDIGLFFTTYLTFAGAWFIAALALAGGNVGFGAAVFAAYWLGRAATVWIGPWLAPNATITPRLVLAWQRLYRPFQLLHAATTLAGVAAVLAIAGCAGSSSSTSAAAKTPRSEKVNCDERSFGRFRNAYDAPDNLVIGPLSLIGAGLTEQASAKALRTLGGFKSPLVLRNGHRATITIDAAARGVARVTHSERDRSFAALPASLGLRSCAAGSRSGSRADGVPVTFWPGWIALRRAPACVPIHVRIDGGRPHARVLRFATPHC